MSQPLQAAVLKWANHGERETNLSDFNLKRQFESVLITFSTKERTNKNARKGRVEPYATRQNSSGKQNYGKNARLT
jgi:hypothetical protein